MSRGFVMKKVLALMISFSTISCVQNQESQVSSNQAGGQSTNNLASYSASGNNFKLSLTDAPNKEVAEVVVNIDRILLKAGSESKKIELVMAKDIGQVDLLTLQNGKMMGISDLHLPVGTKVNQARLILKDDGNYIRYKNGNICNLQTPSQQQTGLKILSSEFSIEAGRAYSMVIDFDANKSIVQQGNGGCLLKPVLKWGGITSIAMDDIDDVQSDEDRQVDEEVIVENGNDGTAVEDSTDAGSSTDTGSTTDTGTTTVVIDCNNLGFDPFDPTTYPADFVWQDYEHCF